MVTKSTIAYKCIKVSCVLNVCLLHVLPTLVTILREVHSKKYITEVFEPMHKCKILSLLVPTNALF
jgi:hypothetical protein